ncbi:electron transfer flavoprotein subunit beta/FixA family protein [Ruminiclostridium herbifermentans]|uniref:Electron transfer flavoprotein small subunit n=1 Tax=Ruminiclostridium herbifermentans TaxID=2488810 RepID=A0A4U7JLV7_9FIRM|nr:electron transfer flavoprotein subunit beta/FixA family protein [Ruminiclostridium herbifermentans]QNU66248.1 electron transfer flavoprotein subunit beta/FixA family protein [Ruminiclostridium herbifermentans]
MNIVVCVKAVVNNRQMSSQSLYKLPGIFINPYDIKAVHTALNLKEKHGGRVTVISMAPLAAKNVLKKAKYLGVDEVILLSDNAFAGSDTYATAKIISHALNKNLIYDLIICGEKTLDGETGQVGGSIAASLNLPYIPYVKMIKDISSKNITVIKKSDYGDVVLEAQLPVVITVKKDICEPKYISLRELVKYKDYEPKVWNNKDLSLEIDSIGLYGSPTQVVATYKPVYSSKCQFITEREIIEILK